MIHNNRRAGFTVKALSNQITRYMESGRMNPAPDEGDLTGMQRAVIGFVGDHAGQDIFQRDIEATFNIRRSTATGILQLMEKNGYLLRENVPYDARLKKLVLTQRAVEAHTRAMASLDEMDRRMTQGISPGEMDEFFRTAHKMLENLQDSDLPL